MKAVWLVISIQKTYATCNPSIHYMVKLDDRLSRIKTGVVNQGKYFVINRGRQYGKATALKALAQYLNGNYFVISMDFQLLSTSSFESEHQFATAFAGYFVQCIKDGKSCADTLSQEISVLEEVTADREYDMGMNITKEEKNSPQTI